MFHQFFKPHPALEEIVNNIMISRILFNSLDQKPTVLFPPLPEQCLFFYPNDCMDVESASGRKHTLNSCVILGPQTRPAKITLGYDHLVIKIGFQPGGLHRLLGIPMHELLGNDALDAGELLGSEIYSLNDQLKEAASYQQMIVILEKFLIKKLYTLKQRLPIDKVLPLLIKNGGLLPIDRIADLSCLSTRQFERTFKDRIGLSPKFFSRLVRFSNAWVEKESCPDSSWTEIASKCGYYDQMHLIRDFKEFAAANPSVIETALRGAPVNLQNRVFH